MKNNQHPRHEAMALALSDSVGQRLAYRVAYHMA